MDSVLPGTLIDTDAMLAAFERASEYEWMF